MRSHAKAASAAAVVCGWMLAMAGPAAAQGSACADLINHIAPNLNLVSAQDVAADDLMPAHCRVHGVVRPAINFVLRLPTAEAWNGRFYMAGCGGFCGGLDDNPARWINETIPAVNDGYAAVRMDSGHWGSSVVDATWAYNDRQAEIDWGHRAVPAVAEAARGLTEAYYAAAPEYSYFQGCSTGGRQASMLALRQPELFDGILNGAPALDYPGLVAVAHGWFVQANTAEDGSQIIGASQLPIIQEAVYAACDPADGVEDGLISDPMACDFDPASLTCPAEGGESCLSEAQVETLQAWYRGPRNSAGEQLYPGGQPLGAEPYWWLWLTGNADGAGRLVPLFNQNFLRFMAFAEDPGEAYSPMDFDFDADPARLALMNGIYNSDNPDIGAFAAAGGRMLIFHGWADAIVTPFKTVDYYQGIVSALGGLESAQQTARLFMLPGVDHCGILGNGPGIDMWGIDPLSALVAWVEQDTPPEQLMMTRSAEGQTGQWTRPACAWPQTAILAEGADWRDGANWTCQTAE